MEKHTQLHPASLVRLKQLGQVVIPKDIRDQLGLAEGDYLDVSTDGRRVVLTPVVLTDRAPAGARKDA